MENQNKVTDATEVEEMEEVTHYSVASFFKRNDIPRGMNTYMQRHSMALLIAIIGKKSTNLELLSARKRWKGDVARMGETRNTKF